LNYFKLITNNKKIKIKKKIAKNEIDRTLNTSYLSKNLEIWEKSIFHQQLKLKDIVKTII
jgi:hypothetical protein